MSTSPDMRQIKEEVFLWCEKSGWKGYDPFDGLTSPLLKKLPQNRWIRLALLQLVKRSPINLRPLFRIQPQENAMTWASAILGALEAFQRGETSKKAFIRKGAERLFSLQTEGTHLWGYPFPWQAKAFYLDAHKPNLVLSALCLRALAKAILALPQEELSTKWHGRCQLSAQALYANFYKKEAGCFSYVAHDFVLVHNANLLGVESLAWFLPEKKEAIETAVQKTITAQEISGRWPYGNQSYHEWCDNFHTAYNLISLNNIYSVLKQERIESSIKRGLNYYLTHAFTKDNRPRYYDNQTYPLETHSAAVALICLNEMVKGGWLRRELARGQAQKTCDCLKRDFYLGKGEFLYRQGRFFKNKTVFTRWTQAWVYAGLEAAASLFNS